MLTLVDVINWFQLESHILLGIFFILAKRKIAMPLEI